MDDHHSHAPRTGESPPSLTAIHVLLVIAVLLLAVIAGMVILPYTSDPVADPYYLQQIEQYDIQSRRAAEQLDRQEGQIDLADALFDRQERLLSRREAIAGRIETALVALEAKLEER